MFNCNLLPKSVIFYVTDVFEGTGSCIIKVISLEHISWTSIMDFFCAERLHRKDKVEPHEVVEVIWILLERETDIT